MVLARGGPLPVPWINAHWMFKLGYRHYGPRSRRSYWFCCGGWRPYSGFRAWAMSRMWNWPWTLRERVPGPPSNASAKASGVGPADAQASTSAQASCGQDAHGSALR